MCLQRTATERVRFLASRLIWDLTATERVRDVSSVDARCEFTTPRRISMAFWATACGVTPVLTSGRSELGTNSYATGDSHPFSYSQIPDQPSCQLLAPVQLQSDPRSTELPVFAPVQL